MDTAKKYKWLDAAEPTEAGAWIVPMSDEDLKYLAYFRKVCKRYNIVPSKATELEYNFVMQVAESEFYSKKANA